MESLNTLHNAFVKNPGCQEDKKKKKTQTTDGNAIEHRGYSLLKNVDHSLDLKCVYSYVVKCVIPAERRGPTNILK